MNKISFIVITALFFIGCNGEGHDKGRIRAGKTVVIRRPEPNMPPVAKNVPHISSSTATDGLELRLEIVEKKTSFIPGEVFTVKITAINRAGRPIRITGKSGSPQVVYLWWFTDVGWEMIRTYPKASLVLRNDWKLKTGQVREFKMKIEVDKGWPTYSPLTLVARLNGRKSPMPTIPIDVHRPDEEKRIERMKLRLSPSQEDIERALAL